MPLKLIAVRHDLELNICIIINTRNSQFHQYHIRININSMILIIGTSSLTFQNSLVVRKLKIHYIASPINKISYNYVSAL